MRNRMKWIALVLIFLLFPLAAARAEEIVVIDVAPMPSPSPALPAPATPEPTPGKKLVYMEKDWTQEEIDAAASVYWADCNSAAEKQAVTVVFFNRLRHGAPFADNLEDVIKQKGEFNHGRISDKNRNMAEYCLNKAWTQYNGFDAGLNIPDTALYVGRENGVMVLKDGEFQPVYTVGGAS
ncbi:MAG: hypothetical protein RR475_03000 [Clostridia bacterium]